jgi:hypothetical protein
MLATALLPALLVSTPPIDPALAERFARLALACAHQEYPNKIAHVMDSDADARPPRELTPAFFGCYDWHSSVHGHWLLARVARLLPEAPLAGEARRALARSLTADNLAAEVRYLEGKGRVSFERPYGLAWLLQLAAELREWGSPEACEWASSLAPLERAAAARLRDWLPKLTRPIRVGEHSQTAFALGLVLDWARVAGDAEIGALVVSQPLARDFRRLPRDRPRADGLRRLTMPRSRKARAGRGLPRRRQRGLAAMRPHAFHGCSHGPRYSRLRSAAAFGLPRTCSVAASQSTRPPDLSAIIASCTAAVDRYASSGGHDTLPRVRTASSHSATWAVCWSFAASTMRRSGAPTGGDGASPFGAGITS